MKRVDVVIPCYKYAHYLTGCVQSVQSQQGIDVRILILDDASPDNTPEVANALARHDGRIEYRRHTINQKHIATYNEGMEWATGDYVLLLSADDQLTPGALRRAAAVFEQHPEVGLVYGRQLVFSGDLPPAVPAVDLLPRWSVVRGLMFVEDACSAATVPVPTPTAVVRNDLIRRLRGYLAELPHTADMELWMRLGVYSDVGCLESVQALKRIHSSNMQLEYFERPSADHEQRLDAFRLLFEHHGRHIPNAEALRVRYLTQLASSAMWEASTLFDDGKAEASSELIDFAEKVHPGILVRPEWKRLRWKRRLGCRFWSLIQPTVRRARNIHTKPSLEAK